MAEGEGTPGPVGGMPLGSDVLECVLDGGSLGWKVVADCGGRTCEGWEVMELMMVGEDVCVLPSRGRSGRSL